MLGSLLVLLGGVLVATLPRSTPLVQVPLIGLLRTHMLGRMLGLTLVMAGLGLLGAAWLHLCRRAAHGESDVADVRSSTAMWTLPLLVAPPLFSRDGWSYAAQGALVRLGWSPYEYGPNVLTGPIHYGVDPRWAHTPTPYGPLPLIAGEQFVGLTSQPWTLVMLHRLLALVGLVLLSWAVPRLARWGGANPALATAIVCGSPLMLANGVAGLHNDLLMAGLMAAGLALGRHRWGWGAAVVGLAAAVKAPAVVVCVPLVLLSLPPGAGVLARVRRAAQVGAIVVTVVVGLGALSGLGVGWLHALSVPGSISTPLSVTSLLGGALDWLVGADPGGHPMRELLRAAGTVAALGVAIRCFLRARTGAPTVAVRVAALTVGALVVLSPVVHLWYLLWALPFVAAIALRGRAFTALIATSVIAGLVAPLDSSLHGAYAAIVTGIMWALVAAVALLATRAARERLRRITSPPPSEVAPPAPPLAPSNVPFGALPDR